MSDIIAIGSDVFVNYFQMYGMSAFRFKEDCEEVINFVNSVSPQNKMFIISKALGSKCLLKLERLLKEIGSVYIILPEPKDVSIDDFSKRYDEIIKVLLGI